MGIERVLRECPSGRGFLQEYGADWEQCPDVGHYFGTLKSKRRLVLLDEFNWLVLGLMAKNSSGPLVKQEVLEDFDVYVGDGHWHGASVHDPIKGATKHAVGHLYGLNLQTGGMFHLSTGDQENRLKEHDMRGLKRLEIDRLRMGAPKGRKVLWIWDSAGITFWQWYNWKQASSIYFIVESPNA